VNRFLSSTFAACALGASAIVAPAAQAADLGSPRMAVAASVIAPAYDWTGFYVGAHAGYKWGGGYYDQFNDFYFTNGVIAGPFAGFNWQFRQVVLGIEADWGWASNSFAATNFGPGFSARLNSLGSVRGRLGVAVDRFHFYATAGIALASQTYTPIPAINTGPATRLHTGWIAGLGVEAMVTPNLVVRAEYLRFDPGQRTYDIGLGGYQADIRPGNIVRVGLAYKFSWGGASAVVARY
jgi:outer membrane immunogenic protein